MTLIGIDASRATVTHRTGTESYSLHIIRELLSLPTDHRFRLYFRDDPPAGLFPESAHVETVVIRQARLWTHLGLGRVVRADPPDVLFVPAHVIPWPHVGSVPAVVTVHDVGYRHYPQAHPLAQRLYLDWSTAHSVRTASAVIAVSQVTANDVSAAYHIPMSNIHIVHSGVDESFSPVTDLHHIVRVRDRYSIPGPYILHVGSIHPRKNALRLVKAFTRVARVVPDLQLVFAGRPGWGFDRLKQVVREANIQDRVIFCDYVPDHDMPALYSAARVCAFPSLYEGFGFPALEAMACGVPMVCSNSSSLPEIAGEAALTFNPLNVAEISEALIRVLTDEELHALMARRGLDRARQFSWKSAARDTLQLLEETAKL